MRNESLMIVAAIVLAPQMAQQTAMLVAGGVLVLALIPVPPGFTVRMFLADARHAYALERRAGVGRLRAAARAIHFAATCPF